MLKLSGVLAAALLATSAVAQSTCPTPNRCGAYATTYCSRFLGITNTQTTTTATETSTETATETSTTTTVTETVTTVTETSTDMIPPTTETSTTSTTTTTTTTTTTDVGTITSSAACTAVGGTIEQRQAVSIDAITYTNVPPCFKGIRRSNTSKISSRCQCLSLMPHTTTVDGGTTTATETSTTTVLTDTTVSVTATETTTTTIDGGTTTITETSTATETSTVTESTASNTIYVPPATFVIMGANPQNTNLPNQPSPANGLYGVLSQDGDAQPIDFTGATDALGTQFTLNAAGNLVVVNAGDSLVTPVQNVAYLSDVDAENPYLITYGTDANTTIPVLCRTFVAVDGTCPLRCRSGPVYVARRQKTCGASNSYYVGRGADNLAGDQTCARFRPMVMGITLTPEK